MLALKANEPVEMHSAKNEQETMRLYILIIALSLLSFTMHNVDMIIIATFSQFSLRHNSPATTTAKAMNIIICNANLLPDILSCTLFIVQG